MTQIEQLETLTIAEGYLCDYLSVEIGAGTTQITEGDLPMAVPSTSVATSAHPLFGN